MTFDEKDWCRRVGEAKNGDELRKLLHERMTPEELEQMRISSARKNDNAPSIEYDKSQDSM